MAKKRNVPLMVYLTSEEMATFDKLVFDNGVEKRSHFLRGIIQEADAIFKADTNNGAKVFLKKFKK